MLKEEFKDAEWGRQQPRVRRYSEVLGRLERRHIPAGFKCESYGSVHYDDHTYPLVRVIPQSWNPDKPAVLISGGVHGGEVAGVEGAMACLHDILPSFRNQFNLVLYPCLNPSSYEIDSRWTLFKQDLNRNFKPDSTIAECIQFIESLGPLPPFKLSMDLHESLQRDAEIMRIQARDLGSPHTDSWGEIPTGYFIYEDSPVYRPGQKRIGQRIVQAVDSVMPVCRWPTIAKDRNENGVIYCPQGLNENSDYMEPVAMDSFLRAAGMAEHAFTSETPDQSETGDVFSIEHRAKAHVTAVRAALEVLEL